MAENNRLPETFIETVRKWKNKPPANMNGRNAFEQDNNNDFLCPICFEIISEAHMTKCGHSFCGECIKKSLANSKKCPKCNFIIESINEIFPNFLLNELIAKHRSRLPDPRKEHSHSIKNSPYVSEFYSVISRENYLSTEEIDAMLDILEKKKVALEADYREAQIIILQEFLTKVKSHKEEELKCIQQQLEVVNNDVQVAEKMLKKHHFDYALRPEVMTAYGRPQNSENADIKIESEPSPTDTWDKSHFLMRQFGFNGSRHVHELVLNPTLAQRRKRMHEHFNELEKSYLSYRSKDIIFNTSNSDKPENGLASFDRDLCKFGKFNMVRPLATLNYSSDTFVGSNIVSSIEFDKDNEYFAIAGVTKKIKVFEYEAVIRESIDMHYAVNEMTCNSKISCISWSTFHKNMLASSDYEGTVTIWDAFTSQKVKTFQEHEKRCWSVDFNRVDPQLIASGSDDAKVKLWATNMEHSFDTLEVKANVCCVKFNPESKNYLAFGSADHCVHYYDLRNVSQAVEVFKGHKKAVSYVKFLNDKEIVSASTDSQLKLWNVNQSYSLRSFKGHLNEKNFVGLATDGDFVACGSENNSLYVYYKGLSTQMLTFKFETIKSILDKDKKEDDSNEFVSAVCWRVGCNVIVAANSQGNIKILEIA